MDKKVTAGVIATVLLAVFTIIASLLFCDFKGCEQDDRKTILEVSDKLDNLNRSFDNLNRSFDDLNKSFREGGENPLFKRTKKTPAKKTTEIVGAGDEGYRSVWGKKEKK